jgi:phosphoglycolate phosphatase
MSVHVSFDLDGTILHSWPSVQSAMTEALEGYGKSLEFVTANGETLDKMIMNLGIVDNALRKQIKERFKYLYDTKYCLNAIIYPGMVNFLKQLNNDGIILNLITNKRGRPTEKIIQHFELNAYFQNICCVDTFPTLDTKAKLLEHFFFPSGQNIYIGDLYEDYIAATLSGYLFYHVNWGYGSRSSEYQTFLDVGELYDSLKIV